MIKRIPGIAFRGSLYYYYYNATAVEQLLGSLPFNRYEHAAQLGLVNTAY